MKLSKADERRLLALPGVTVNGRKPAKREKPAELIEPDIKVGNDARIIINVAIDTDCEINGRSWKAMHRRNGAAWRAVREAVGVHLDVFVVHARDYCAGLELRAKFTRIGGRRLDPMANLGTSMKGCEDAICYLLGIDDGSPQWVAKAEQEPGPGPVGVRIEIGV